jgi:hypothetical protein
MLPPAIVPNPNLAGPPSELQEARRIEVGDRRAALGVSDLLIV